MPGEDLVVDPLQPTVGLLFVLVVQVFCLGLVVVVDVVVRLIALLAHDCLLGLQVSTCVPACNDDAARLRATTPAVHPVRERRSHRAICVG